MKTLIFEFTADELIAVELELQGRIDALAARVAYLGGSDYNKQATAATASALALVRAE